MTATRDALAERLQNVRDTASLLYNRMIENVGYRQQERLKDIVEKEAEEEEQPTATKEKGNTDLTTHENEHIKIQVENSRVPESAFSLDKIMHLSIKFDLCQVSRSQISMSYESVPR